MGAVNLLAAGSGEATSAPFTLEAGATMTLAGAARPAGATYWRVDVERQFTDGAWESVGQLRWDMRMLTLYGDGVYRLRRLAGGGCLVDGAQA